MNDFDEIAAYYDAMYSDRDEDTNFYLDLVKEVEAPILECGCGTGRVLIPIARKGKEIWGIDDSQAMLNIAKEKIKNLEPAVQKRTHIYHQDMRKFRLDYSFSLCIIPFRAFLHLLTWTDQNIALQQIHKHLQKNGKLVFDIFAPSYELLARNTTTINLEHSLKQEPGYQITIKDHICYEHAKQLIHVERIYTEKNEDGTVHKKVMPFTLRYIFRYEMQALLENNGFRLSKVFGHFDKRPYDYESGEMIFVAEKK